MFVVSLPFSLLSYILPLLLSSLLPLIFLANKTWIWVVSPLGTPILLRFSTIAFVLRGMMLHGSIHLHLSIKNWRLTYWFFVYVYSLLTCVMRGGGLLVIYMYWYALVCNLGTHQFLCIFVYACCYRYNSYLVTLTLSLVRSSLWAFS